jgi:hypothetical protein
MSHHVEPGNIFKRIGGIKMEDRSEELADSVEFIDWEVPGPDGTPVKVTLI